MRLKPRRTLGGLMVLIALVAVPLAWYAYQAREIARQRMVADAHRAIVVARMHEILKQVNDRAKLDARRLESPALATEDPPR